MTTFTIQPDPTAGKDNYIDSGAATTNVSTGATLFCGDASASTSAAQRPLIAFDVSAIPAGALILSVTVKLWEQMAASTGGAPASWLVELRRLLRAWVETESTWNKWSTAGGNWGTAGAANASDRVDAASASLTLDATIAGAFVEFTGAGLVADVQAWVDGTATNYGWLITALTAEYAGTTATSYTGFYSSDYTTVTTRRPTLVVVYSGAPRITTAAIGNVGSNEAAGGGEVTAEGTAAVTARGVCWNTSGSPTIADAHTTDGSGAGAFTSTMTGLTPQARYHVRAYATNSEGTSYGVEVAFTNGSFVRRNVPAPSLSLLVGSDTLGWAELAGSAVIGERTKGMPGGDGSLTFTLPPDVARGARNQLQHGARVKLSANGAPDFGGRICNDSLGGVLTSVKDAIAVECSGLWAWSDRYGAFAWVWNDSDTAQWTTTAQAFGGDSELIASGTESTKYTADTEGRLFILADRANSFAPYSHYSLDYWLLGGLETGCEIVGLDVEYMCNLPVFTATWNAQTSGSTAELSAVAFSDASHGWAVGDSGTILATTNGGATWSAQTSGSSTWLRGVACSDASHAWAVGGGGTILATTNGGATWSAQDPGASPDLIAVAFLADGLHGWAVGFAGSILVTTNGGATWSAQDSGGGAWLYGVACSDASHAWAVGDGGTILATTNGGATWSAQDPGEEAAEKDLAAVAFLSDGLRGWVAGDSGIILATVDGGGTWDRQDSGSIQRLTAVAFLADGLHGWAAGLGGAITGTIDGGGTWVLQNSGGIQSRRGVALSDSIHGWAVGSAGTILAYKEIAPGPWKLWFSSQNNPWEFPSYSALNDGETTSRPDSYSQSFDLAPGDPNRCLSVVLWRMLGGESPGPVNEVVSDPWVWVRSVVVRCRMEGEFVDRTVNLSDVLCEMATKPGLATVTAGENISLGAGNNQMAVRSMTSIRSGMADLAGLYSGELEYWFDLDEDGADRFNHYEKPVEVDEERNSCWSYGEAAGESIAGLTHDPEACPDWIRMTYLSDGVAEIPDGTPRDVWYPATPPTDYTASVHVITEFAGQMFTDAHAASVAQRVHERIAASTWSGSVPVPLTVTDTRGRERGGWQVRPGDRLSVPSLDGAGDLYVTEAAWNWTSLTGTATVGYPWAITGGTQEPSYVAPFVRPGTVYENIEEGS